MNIPIYDFSFLVFTIFFEPQQSFVARVLERLTSRPNSRSIWGVDTGPLDLSRVYFRKPQTGGLKPITAAIWSPANMNDVCVFFPNSSDGWNTLVKNMSSQSQIKSISVRTSGEGAALMIQEIQLRAFGTEGRLLRAMDDDRGIEYFQSGQSLPEEHLPDPKFPFRNGRKDVIAYLKCFDIKIDDVNFWQSNSDATYLHETRIPRFPTVD